MAGGPGWQNQRMPAGPCGTGVSLGRAAGVSLRGLHIVLEAGQGHQGFSPGGVCVKVRFSTTNPRQSSTDSSGC